MRLIRSLLKLGNEAPALPPLCLTIGNFDGLHLAHQEIIKKVKKISLEKNLASAVLTFEPHPAKLLKSKQAVDFRIFGNAQKIAAFREISLDYLLIFPFNQSLRELSADEFVQKILIDKLNLQHLVIGHDFTFGKNRQGNFESLKAYKFGLSEILPISFKQLLAIDSSSEKEGSKEFQQISEDLIEPFDESMNFAQIISSTAIRGAITSGRPKEAKRLLGRRFSVDGRVINGKKLGRELGFRTMNLMAKPHIIKPKFGVYKTSTFIPHLQQKFDSITNFGIKPSLNQQDNLPIFETHIPNFSGKEIYGKKIVVEFEEFIRSEQRFSSLEELKMQIEKDLEAIF